MSSQYLLNLLKDHGNIQIRNKLIGFSGTRQIQNGTKNVTLDHKVHCKQSSLL